MYSSLCTTQILIGTIIYSLLFIVDNLQSVEYIWAPVQWSLVLACTQHYIIIDTVIRLFLLSFITQVAMLIGFLCYCDCAYIAWLECKLLIFYVFILHLLLSSMLFTQLLVFELIGITSFRLIGHYSFRITALRGSIIALGTNKIGDILLLLTISKLTTIHCKYLPIEPILADIFIYSLAIKSVSIISFIWLPDAMEGPTPVSALLHSATLVIAGIIVISKAYAACQTTIVTVLLCIGILLVISSVLIDVDCKKIAAISTSIMISLLWLEVNYNVINSWQIAKLHAGYKSILFLLLAILSSAYFTQDIRIFLYQ